ncbi:MAG: protein kinase [Acidobacteriia bacterium]|nr:protein kinase [Terriglobia bacterium]
MSFFRAPWWMYIVAASFLTFFGLQMYTASPFFAGPGPLGILWDVSSPSLIVGTVEPGSVAERAGLHPGDRVVAINEVPIHRRVEWDVAGMNFEVGRPALLGIERDGQRVNIEVRFERLAGQEGPGFIWLLAAGNFIMLILACVVAFRRPQDPLARLGGWFLATTAITIFPPVYGMAPLIRALPLPVQLMLWVTIVSTSFLPAMLFTFVAAFPQPLFRQRWIWGLVWGPIVLLAVPRWFESYASLYQRPQALARYAMSVPAWFALFGLYLLGGLVVMVVNYRRLQDVSQRRRLRVLTLGTIIGWIAIGLFLTIIVVGGGRTIASLAPLLPFLLCLYLLFPLSFAYAILRHRVFDVGLLVRRGVQYALARRLLVSAVPVLGAILLLDLLAHGNRPMIAVLATRGWVYGGLAVLAGIAYTQRQKWLEALDRRFFRERYDAHRLLREVVEEVRGARDFVQVAPRAVARIDAAMHPEFVSLLMRQPHEPAYHCLAAAPQGYELAPLPAQSKLMSLVRLLGKPLEMPQTGSGWLKEQLPHDETAFLRQSRIELIVPIATSAEHTEALLALGVKRSEEPYTREDMDLLVAAASSLALLLEKPPAPARPRSDVFTECPTCGVCYDSGATACARENSQLVPVILPRLLGGRYQLERRLGRGGMGTVYEASDTALERRVAVKVIREDLVGSADAAERFRREARVAASFSHPNVVTVHDFGVVSNTRAFLVMELLEGRTVREELWGKRRFSTARVLAVVRDACSALQAAHQRQLVHRDLKPENIFLVAGHGGEAAKILDFGIAKFLSTATLQPTADTAPGAVMGTLRYMSPEQWRGGEPAAAWDLWALAVVAYEMLAGAYPFDGHTPADWFGAGAAVKFTPLADNLPGVSPAAQGFFERAFALGSGQRPQSAAEFLADLQRAVG